jgi:hypothetical protein
MEPETWISRLRFAPIRALYSGKGNTFTSPPPLILPRQEGGRIRIAESLLFQRQYIAERLSIFDSVPFLGGEH